MKHYLIGIDCGSTMVKAAIFDTLGKELAVASRKVEHIYLRPDWTENDMNALWRSVCEVLRDVIAKSEIDPKAIACVTCTGHGNGLYLVAKDDTPARNGILSSDNRARKYVEQWTAGDVLARILPKTMQNLWAAQPNALLRWLIDNEPETMRNVKWLFMVKDFVRYRLTGEAYMELSDMSGTSLIDVGRACYDDEVLETWGLSEWRDIMPPLKRSGVLCGTITRKAAELTGLSEGTPVAGGMFDIDACGLAVGMTDETRFCMVAGTWGNNQFIVPCAGGQNILLAYRISLNISLPDFVLLHIAGFHIKFHNAAQVFLITKPCRDNKHRIPDDPRNCKGRTHAAEFYCLISDFLKLLVIIGDMGQVFFFGGFDYPKRKT